MPQRDPLPALRAQARLAILLVPVLAGLSGVAACGGDPKPPESCPWAASPADIVKEDLVGRYQGTNADNKPITLELSADGRYTATNLKMRDWLSGSWLDVDSTATWSLTVERMWYHRFIDDPPPATVQLTDQYKTELRVGGTRGDPVLYDVLDHGSSCDKVRSLLRQT